MSLRLTFEQYNSLDLLYKALSDLNDFAFWKGAKPISDCRDRGEVPSRPEMQQLAEVAVGIGKANLMLGEILLKIMTANREELGQHGVTSTAMAAPMGVTDAAILTN